jgi:hypothetical protein
LGVDDIDSLLQPPQEPPPPMPIDAGLENNGFMMGQPAMAFEQQNHSAHIDAHRSLFLTDVVKTNPQLQTGQLPPDQAQMATQELQMIVEQFSAPILAQLTQELLISIGQGNEEDPLVQIRQQELDLRGAELAAEQNQFEEKQESRRREKLLEAEIAKQRINTSKEVADDKLDLALQRLQQQANLKLTELQTKFGGSR